MYSQFKGLLSHPAVSKDAKDTKALSAGEEGDATSTATAAATPGGYGSRSATPSLAEEEEEEEEGEGKKEGAAVRVRGGPRAWFFVAWGVCLLCCGGRVCRWVRTYLRAESGEGRAEGVNSRVCTGETRCTRSPTAACDSNSFLLHYYRLP